MNEARSPRPVNLALWAALAAALVYACHLYLVVLPETVNFFDDGNLGPHFPSSAKLCVLGAKAGRRLSTEGWVLAGVACLAALGVAWQGGRPGGLILASSLAAVLGLGALPHLAAWQLSSFIDPDFPPLTLREVYEFSLAERCLTLQVHLLSAGDPLVLAYQLSNTGPAGLAVRGKLKFELYPPDLSAVRTHPEEPLGAQVSLSGRLSFPLAPNTTLPAPLRLRAEVELESGWVVPVYSQPFPREVTP